MGSWLLKLLSRDNKKQTKKTKNRKTKSIGNITPTMNHYPENE